MPARRCVPPPRRPRPRRCGGSSSAPSPRPGEPGSMTWVAPCARASSRRSAMGSLTRIVVAPAWTAHCVMRLPMGPPPITSTVSPRRTPARSTPCAAQARGSVNAASSSPSVSGSAYTLVAGITHSSASAPSLCTPIELRCLAQVLVPRLAVRAGMADPVGVHRDPVARGKAAHGGACLDDLPRELVPDHDGVAGGVLALVQRVVRAAHAAGPDPDEDLVGGGPGIRKALHPHVLCLVKHCCQHARYSALPGCCCQGELGGPVPDSKSRLASLEAVHCVAPSGQPW